MNFTPEGWVMIIGAISLLLVNFNNSRKLTEIHTLTNSNLDKLQKEMDAMRLDNEYFKKIISGLMLVAPKDSIDKVRGDVGRRVGIQDSLATSAQKDRDHTDIPFNPSNATITTEHKESIKVLADSLEIKPKDSRDK